VCVCVCDVQCGKIDFRVPYAASSNPFLLVKPEPNLKPFLDLNEMQMSSCNPEVAFIHSLTNKL